jgi:hypothetical protein
MIKIIDELKDTDFASQARRVISEWGKEKYSKNIHSASALAVKTYNKKSYIQESLLKLFIYMAK